MNEKMEAKRIDIKAILADPEKRRELMISCIMAMQEHEGRDANREQAEKAYRRALNAIRER